MTTHPTPPLGDTRADAMRMVPDQIIQFVRDNVKVDRGPMGTRYTTRSTPEQLYQVAALMSRKFAAAPLATASPEAVGAGREEIADIIRDHVSGPEYRGDEVDAAHRKDQLHAADAILAALSPASPARTPMGETDALVDRFAEALKAKLRAAGEKYGFDDAWKEDDWREKLIGDLWRHVQKGDPRDVAAYCAFAWHHGWSLAAPAPVGSGVEGLREALKVAHSHLQHMAAWITKTNASDTPLHGYSFEALGEDKWIIDQALATPTPMGGEVEALREAASGVADALHDAAHVKTRNLEAAITNLADLKVIAFKAATALREALAASSPSPAQGGEEAEKLTEIVSDAEIVRVHGYANFGSMSPREVVNDGVLKTAVGYHCGHTQFSILREHGLVTKPRLGSYDAHLTKKGKAYARALYCRLAPPSVQPAETASPQPAPGVADEGAGR